ncbi:MAG: SCP2 sterol-binding domain-containing protein [Deltaproteobacteria bacterium]|nr:SCP2 sterol-binding domain-containing protein [Deltaproteobacteria bacterium]
MGKSAKEMFDVLLPKGLAENAAKANAIGVEYAFKVSGPNGGNWTVDLKSSPPAVNPEASTTAQCTVSIADSDFEALMADLKIGMQLFTQGKLKVGGNPALAMKLEQVFQLAAT